MSATQMYETDTIAETLVQGVAPAVEQLVARVLCRAHRMAESHDAPVEARVVLRVAHSFADELATADPEFDRTRFIHTVTDGRL